MRQWYQVDGEAVRPGVLVETARGWVEPTPVYCPNGHRLRVDVVGWIPCSAPGRGGHRSHTCECGGCDLFDGMSKNAPFCEKIDS